MMMPPHRLTAIEPVHYDESIKVLNMKFSPDNPVAVSEVPEAGVPNIWSNDSFEKNSELFHQIGG